MYSFIHEKLIFLTGATSGIGRVAACTLAKQGANVIATVRNEDRGKDLIKYFQKHYPMPEGNLQTIQCDLSSFASIHSAIEAVNEKYSRLDTLINNAGVWKERLERTEDGVETILQVNVLAPHLFMTGFKDLLSRSKDARIINTASCRHKGNIRFDNIEFTDDFKGFKVYRQSKLAVILLSRLMAVTLKREKIAVYSVHPGLVRTNLARDTNWFKRNVFLLLGTSPTKGAETMLYLANASRKDLISGEYYVNKKISTSSELSKDIAVARKLVLVLNQYTKTYQKNCAIKY
ncbi:SDR family NAD(P)-dependent oxidoreductase [Carboxylicivirga marina]|uniref:SDR family NAD(P)-dependent oxidoreductase n=1 Tax=Carboxylicivirga marina TaxID=2800988 RepID=UPI0025949AF9|nr:SDR family NAD(P)-dependent oxidoreductase [uncultured Carboxylicivirga sp.]